MNCFLGRRNVIGLLLIFTGVGTAAAPLHAGSIRLKQRNFAASYADTDAPLAVGTLLALVGSHGVTLVLSQGVSGGIGNGYGYQIYRGREPHFTPNKTSLIATPTSLPYTDPFQPAPFTVSYYKVVAHDSTGATVNVFPAGITRSSVSSITTPLAAPAASQLPVLAPPTPQEHYRNVINVVNIGDSVTAGAGISSHNAPPVALAADLAAREGTPVFFSNQGVSGTTTADWQPGGSLLLGAKRAADSLNAAHSGAQLVFSIMLGTNDSATAGTNGAPVSERTYESNLTNIIDRLLADYPTCKIFLHHPLWYSPNTHNGSDYQETGLARLVGYLPVLDSLVISYNRTRPRHVYAGDKKAYGYFAQHYLSRLTPESGAAGYGTFYLHPTAQGAEDLGRFQSEAIAAGLL